MASYLPSQCPQASSCHLSIPSLPPFLPTQLQVHSSGPPASPSSDHSYPTLDFLETHAKSHLLWGESTGVVLPQEALRRAAGHSCRGSPLPTSPACDQPFTSSPSPYLALRCCPQTRQWGPPLGAGILLHLLHPRGLCVSSTSLPRAGVWGFLSPPPGPPPLQRRVKVGLGRGEGVRKRGNGWGK